MPILDYKFCERRLENVNGFLVCQFPEGGTPQIYFTNEPCIDIPILEIPMGEPGFEYINASLGEDGCMRRLTPGSGVDGWLRAIDGRWVISALPSEVFPEPFEIENLIVNETATITDLVVVATLCFDALPEDTVVDTVGLNAEGCLVKGGTVASTQSDVAIYYENATLTSTATPNYDKDSSEALTIGNQIYDPAALFTIISPTQIKALKAGSYRIDWMAYFDGGGGDTTGGGVQFYFGDPLVLTSLSAGRQSGTGNGISKIFVGTWAGVVAVDDLLELRVNPTAHATGNDVSDVKIVITRLHE